MASQVESIKWVPGTRFIVDGFKFQSPRCRHYFLTHAHSDHTIGLNQSFNAGLIYCSPVTYKLLVHDMHINPQLLRPLELNKTAVIDGTEVIPISANHCPGAVCFIFRVPAGTFSSSRAAYTTIFHTGDFRWCPEQHGKHPKLVGGVDVLMLDTTYLQSPKWTFPPQKDAIEMMVQIMREEIRQNDQKSVLFVCSSYHIGKERAYFGAALALGWKIWVPPAKRRVLRLLELPQSWMELLTDAETEAQIHVLSSSEQLHVQSLTDRIQGTQWSRVVVFRPTGWTYRPSGKLDRREDGCVTTIGVPYSEHSSYTELQDCVKTLRPKKLIPTVNASDPVKARALVDRLCGFMDLSQDKTRLDSYFLAAAEGKLIGLNDGSSGIANGDDVHRRVGNSDRDGGLRHNRSIRDVEEVDLDAVDVEEQRRLLEEITARAQKKQKVEDKRQSSIENDGNKKSSAKSILSYFVKQ